MKITRFLDEQGHVRTGIDLGDGTADLLHNPDPLHATPQPTGHIARIDRRLAPVEPINIFCIGLNYRRHAEETGAVLPDHPVVFMKPVTAAHDPERPILIPQCCERGDEVDYEVELAVVIGKAGRDIPESRALEHVFGYTVANDVSARRWQKHGGGGQWIRGKSFDTFCPLGPVLVTADEIPDPQELTLSTRVNDENRQHSTTADMIFTVAQLIEFLSMDTTLLPGTVILTGTPEGVGVARKPPVFLQKGDTVTCAIEGIGELTNPVE
ncbi:MAG: fumarylacetoacetate hydrolase family protein [Phycisphaeraceae bacterium]